MKKFDKEEWLSRVDKVATTEELQALLDELPLNAFSTEQEPTLTHSTLTTADEKTTDG